MIPIYRFLDFAWQLYSGNKLDHFKRNTLNKMKSYFYEKLFKKSFKSWAAGIQNCQGLRSYFKGGTVITNMSVIEVKDIDC